MTLWDLLTGICFGMPIGGALSSASIAKVGFWGYAFAITIGVVLGVGCAWTKWVVSEAVVDRFQGRPNWEQSVPRQEWSFRALYSAAMLWAVFALFLGIWVTAALLRLVF